MAGTDKLGFHQLSVTDKAGKRTCLNPTNIQNKIVLDYTKEMLPPSAANVFFTLAMETDCNKIKTLTAKELISAGIATGVQTLSLSEIIF